MRDPRSLLSAEFRARAEQPEDLFLLSAADALHFVKRGEELGLRLAGVEAFRRIRSGGFQPEQEFSNDVADSATKGDEFVRSTLELIEKGGAQGLLFQVVFE